MCVRVRYNSSCDGEKKNEEGEGIKSKRRRSIEDQVSTTKAAHISM